MKKLLFIIILWAFIWYLYNLGLEQWKIKQAKIEMTNDKIDVSLNNEQEETKKQQSQEQQEQKEDENNKEDLYDLDKITYEKKLVWTEEDGVFMGFPEGPLFGEVLNLDDWKITYSKIENLIIEKKDFDKEQVSNPENIWNTAWTWYLNSDEFGSYVYWNSLRNIDENNREAWKSFYVLEKKDNVFVYSKMYFDFNHKLIWRLVIKEFPIDEEKSISEQMWELNNSLKEQNSDFEEVKKTDFLFKEIIR